MITITFFQQHVRTDDAASSVPVPWEPRLLQDWVHGKIGYKVLFQRFGVVVDVNDSVIPWDVNCITDGFACFQWNPLWSLHDRLSRKERMLGTFSPFGGNVTRNE